MYFGWVWWTRNALYDRWGTVYWKTLILNCARSYKDKIRWGMGMILPWLQDVQDEETYTGSVKQWCINHAVVSQLQTFSILERNKIRLHLTLMLKTLDTIGYCQRLVFSLDVIQHARNKPVNNLSSINWSSKLRDNNEIRKKNTLVTRSCVRFDGWYRDLKF